MEANGYSFGGGGSKKLKQIAKPAQEIRVMLLFVSFNLQNMNC